MSEIYEPGLFGFFNEGFCMLLKEYSYSVFCNLAKVYEKNQYYQDGDKLYYQRSCTCAAIAFGAMPCCHAELRNRMHVNGTWSKGDNECSNVNLWCCWPLEMQKTIRAQLINSVKEKSEDGHQNKG